jgi:hypothetical protein
MRKEIVRQDKNINKLIMKAIISKEQQIQLLNILKNRFEKHQNRHPYLQWVKVQEKLKDNPDKLQSLYEMETTGGEPDVIALNDHPGEYVFLDCCAETPSGRRSICYDHEALESRKEHKPVHSAVGMAVEMGVELLSEEQYRELQKTGIFDLKTSSWIKTPSDIREKGGALFADYRYGHVFVYHNGASSYYSSRGFRSLLRV